MINAVWFPIGMNIEDDVHLLLWLVLFMFVVMVIYVVTDIVHIIQLRRMSKKLLNSKK